MTEEHTKQQLGSVEYGLLSADEYLYRLDNFPHATDLSLEEISERKFLNDIRNNYRLMIIPFKNRSGEMTAELFKITESAEGEFFANKIPTIDSEDSLIDIL